MNEQNINSKIKVVKGDITKIKVDAIVNAANSSLMGGGGVDGAIHASGGKEILEQCILIVKKQGELKTGEAVITTAGKLNAKYVIHTVGPVWNDGKNKEEDLLSNCYRNSLRIAVDHNVKTIAFPGISTGVYRFPKELAAMIAVTEANLFLQKDDTLEEIIFVCFDEMSYNIYMKLLEGKT